MFIQILQVILIFAMFILIRWFAWKVTEVWGLPEWLQYKPWNCKLCLTLWSLLFSYLTVGLIFHLPITLYGGIALAILNALAMWIDQRNKTIRIEDL